MSHLALFTYHPNVGTFRGGRGAWRVARCYPVPADGVPVPPHASYDFTKRHKVLVMEVPRQLPVGVWVNPTKLLRELLATWRPISPQRRYA